MSSIEEDTKRLLAETLQLGDRVSSFDASTPLLGSLPELDSMAVVHIITALEENYGFMVDDDEISADVFETFGSLVAFVDQKMAQG